VVEKCAASTPRLVEITGGEPLLQKGFPALAGALNDLPGRKVLVETNGSIDISLVPDGVVAVMDIKCPGSGEADSLDPEKFRRITRWGTLADTWRGILAAEEAGLTPIKLNVVVVRGYNETDVVDLARLTLEHEWEVRFIELMPLGSEGEFALGSLVPSSETRARIESEFGQLEEVPGYNGEDPSRPFRIPGAAGSVGFISSVTAPFCAGCTRLRLTADGKLRLCLLHDDEVNLLGPLRDGAPYEEIKELIREAAWRKPWGHRLDEEEFPVNREMSQIGG
jgi:cyclic pyranopterin phosphate synthase